MEIFCKSVIAIGFLRVRKTITMTALVPLMTKLTPQANLECSRA